MKINSLKIKNIKKIIHVELSKFDPLTEITGKNGQGKSSIIDSLWYAIGGDKVTPEGVIRKGEKEGSIELSSDIVDIKRDYKLVGDSYKSMVQIIPKTFNGPRGQKELDKLIDGMSFDPMSFLAESPAKKKEMLLEALGDETKSLIDSEARLLEDRRVAGRMRDDAKARLAGVAEKLPANAGNLKWVDSGELNSKIKVLNEELFSSKNFLEKISNKKNLIEKLKKELELAENELTELAKTEVRSEDVIAGEISKLQAEVDTSNEVNLQVKTVEQYRQLEKETDDLVMKYDSITSQLEEVRKTMNQVISGSELLPDKAELVIDDKRILINGIEFSELNTAQQIKYCLLIARRLNPDFKIIIIKEGSLLDSDSKAEIEKYAIDNDCVIIMETVLTDNPNAYIVNNGEVSHA